MKKRHQQPFTTIKTEGALLPADFLQRIADRDPDLEGLTPESYHLAKNERLNEVISRSWTRCKGAWRAFQAAGKDLPESDAGTTLTRERWLLILFQEFGYGRLLTAKAQHINGKSYPISHLWQHTPIHLVSFRQSLDHRTPGAIGAARMSPHSLVQEFLNRSDKHLWGFVSNGLRLRILRDNVSLSRYAYVEFDLEGMMNGEAYSDFVLLWLLCHESRVEAEKPEDCWLERWSHTAFEQGTRALDRLRDGVEEAIKILGSGFVGHPANTELRENLRSGRLSVHDYYRQLLRLVYRMIFLFVAEDRNLLIPESAPAEARRRYLEHYSATRLRRIAASFRGTGHGDLWQGLKVTWRCLIEGEPGLALRPLGSFLFSEDTLPDLNDCLLANHDLLAAVWKLSFTRDRRLLRQVDYRNLGTEELGSVYESLLELHPDVNTTASIFELGAAAGSERKTTGSYYTPASLIKCLLDSALEPVIGRALKEPDPEKALLDLKVVDPACGSGHFLIASAHRIARYLAGVRSGEDEPPPEELRRALRDVVRKCIYGVDVNPLAAELCKVALWIETLDPERPLGFLDNRIKCGNSLIGATPELLENGIPDDAFKPLEGDDKEVARDIRKRNRQERLGQQDMYSAVDEIPDWQQAVDDLRYVAELPEEAVHQVQEKAALYWTALEDETFQHQHQVADLWTAAFFWPLTRDTAAAVPSEDLFRRFQQGSHSLKEEVPRQMQDLAGKHRFFHWHLEFPEVFADEGGGGFDCVVGNPPWEQIELAEKEFFARRDPEIASAPNAAKRKQLIERLKESNNSLWKQYQRAKRSIDNQTKYLRVSNKYPLSAVGRINSYQIFAGLARQLISKQGRAGIVIPSGIATDDSNKRFFADLTEKRSLVSLYDFENREKLFPAVDSRMKFCLLTMGGEKAAPTTADFAFFLTNARQLGDEDRHFTLSAEDIKLLNPNTRTCPIFRSKRDAEITKAIYRRVPVLIDESKGEAGNPWGITFRQGLFNMASDSHLFKTREELEAEGWELRGNIFEKGGERYLPLYEAKMIWHFDHRFGTYQGIDSRSTTHLPISSSSQYRCATFTIEPFYWVSEVEVLDCIAPLTPDEFSQIKNGHLSWDAARELQTQRARKWFVGFRDITNVTNERTVIFSVIPQASVGHTMPLVFFESQMSGESILCILSNLNSYVLDYIARQKVGGTHLTYAYLKQFPVLPLELYKQHEREFVILRAIELTYTARDLEPFAKDCGYTGPPFLWDDDRRFFLRCELDAAYFHLYQVQRADVDYIMETFSIVKRKDIQKYGDYRTKLMILKIYDDMQKAIETGQPYKTLLDPSPADPRVAHPPP